MISTLSSWVPSHDLSLFSSELPAPSVYGARISTDEEVRKKIAKEETRSASRFLTAFLITSSSLSVASID